MTRDAIRLIHKPNLGSVDAQDYSLERELSSRDLFALFLLFEPFM